MQSSRGVLVVRIFECVIALVFGGFVALLGTSVHRAYAPFALIFALIAVLVCIVMMRAWMGFVGVVAFAVGWLIAVQAFALQGPGGDVLMPAQPVTYGWYIGGMLMIAVGCFTPRKWFTEPK